MMLFRQIAIWKRLDKDRAVRFNCVEDIGARKFSVQTADFFHIPIRDEDLAYFERLFPERFIEVERNERDWFNSIEESIAAHEAAFR